MIEIRQGNDPEVSDKSEKYKDTIEDLVTKYFHLINQDLLAMPGDLSTSDRANIGLNVAAGLLREQSFVTVAYFEVMQSEDVNRDDFIDKLYSGLKQGCKDLFKQKFLTDRVAEIKARTQAGKRGVKWQ